MLRSLEASSSVRSIRFGLQLALSLSAAAVAGPTSLLLQILPNEISWKWETVDRPLLARSSQLPDIFLGEYRSATKDSRARSTSIHEFKWSRRNHTYA
jgi:hypothetical protein